MLRVLANSQGRIAKIRPFSASLSSYGYSFGFHLSRLLNRYGRLCIAIDHAHVELFERNAAFFDFRNGFGRDEIKAIEDVMQAKEEHRPNIEIDHEKQKTSIVQEYTVCEKEMAIKKAQIAYVLKNIENQEAEKEALSIEQVSMQEKKMEIEGRIKLLNLTRDFLTNAKNNLSKRYVAPMQEKFSKMLEQVIKEENQKYSLDVDMNVMVEDPTGNKEMEYLSQGYQDLMNICKRFSLIESIFEKEKPLIVLDDPFVNLDDQLNKNALKLIKKLAESYQIVYLSCHTSRRFRSA